MVFQEVFLKKVGSSEKCTFFPAPLFPTLPGKTDVIAGVSGAILNHEALCLGKIYISVEQKKM